MNIDEIDDQIDNLIKIKKKLIQEKIVSCDHPLCQIRECDFEKLNYLGSLPPRRVCLKCGLGEEGYGAGYHFLSPGILDPVNLSRKEVQEATRFFLTQEEYWRKWHLIKDGKAINEDFWPGLKIVEEK
ncbi:MAG: hypothetical protein UT24_C0019G0030 [Candidatus Woesebacteria bacterium GW2011_GWB1_39_12]|uniref:Uncharacterized protein n=1 Tax=Candidatus Woesebacteria bacterium GW2011_GWB1_39_12 TaxID=1618574 RepID=A0A0G0MHY2_9BACT|nr:MAG: hypothetical protein UT24_C0019G0030 [Candidatus Woesebacteria bacterium GW2011_GWB1_39_12]